MSRTAHRLAAVLGLGALLAPPVAAARPALPEWMDPYARVEAGAAFPLRSPQTDYFTTGFGGRLNLGLGISDWFGVQLTGQPVTLPARDIAPTADPAVPVGLGGGVRLKIPNHYVVIPWIDGELLYVRTGAFDRLGFGVGAGLQIPIGPTRSWRVGPYVRFFDVLAPPAPAGSHKLSADAMMFLSGLSVEWGPPRLRIRDRDHDGVADNEDRCPDQPGLPATFGCPDKDADGIVDSLDRCVDQPGPPATYGCPDRDADGIVDAADRCPAEVGPAALGGCPDRDGDGVVDPDDQCPQVPGPARAGGCPDRDGDSVADARDRCPELPGSPAAEGCPDRDGDAVADAIDACPDRPGSPSAAGCPDADHDGVNDDEDECPDQSGSALAGGCPDHDGDSVADADDACPEQPGPADGDGCPSGKGATPGPGSGSGSGAAVASQAGKVYFDFDRADITDSYAATLDELARELSAHPEARLRLEGHADDRGSDQHNRALSRGRASAVKTWFVAHGVSPRRLTVRGWGSSRPAIPERTDEAREKNRRVELTVVR